MPNEKKYHIFHEKAKNINNVPFYEGYFSADVLLERMSKNYFSFGDEISLVDILEENGILQKVIGISTRLGVYVVKERIKTIDHENANHIDNELSQILRQLGISDGFTGWKGLMEFLDTGNEFDQFNSKFLYDEDDDNGYEDIDDSNGWEE